MRKLVAVALFVVQACGCAFADESESDYSPMELLYNNTPKVKEVKFSSLVTIEPNVTPETLQGLLKLVDEYDAYIEYIQEASIEYSAAYNNAIASLDYIPEEKKGQILHVLNEMEPRLLSIVTEKYENDKKMGVEARNLLQLLIANYGHFIVAKEGITFDTVEAQAKHDGIRGRLKDLNAKEALIENKSLGAIFLVTGLIEEIMYK